MFGILDMVEVQLQCKLSYEYDLVRIISNKNVIRKLIKNNTAQLKPILKRKVLLNKISKEQLTVRLFIISRIDILSFFILQPKSK